MSPNDPPTYALEGSCAYAGATLQWCRDNADLMTDIAAEIETAARSASGTDIDDFEKMEEEITFEEEEEDVIFVPAFSGLYAPHWKSDARGLLIGLTAHHNKNDMLKAALESSAYSVMDVIEAMDKDVHLGSDEEPSDSDANSIKVDGGMAYNKYLMQFQANILNKVIHIPVNMSNMTAMGALYAAGIGCGLYTHNSLPTSSNPDSSKPESSFKDELRQIWKLQSEFYPHMSASRRKFKVDKWHKAIERSCGWAAPPGK